MEGQARKFGDGDDTSIYIIYIVTCLYYWYSIPFWGYTIIYI